MLSNKVSEIMTTRVTSAPISSTVEEVMKLMIEADVGRIIITENKIPAGIFTEKHVLTRLAHDRLDPVKTKIGEVMTSPVRAVEADTRIVDALAEMLNEKIRHLQVVGGSGEIIGLVSMRRILMIAVELGQGLSETKTVGDIMSPGALSVDESVMLEDAVDLMFKKDSSSVVVTAESRPVGIFTERDALTRVVTKRLDLQTPIKEVMTSPLVIMPGTALVGEVLAEMYRRDIRNMPIVGECNELRGLVSMPEVLRYARAFDIDHEVRKAWKEIRNFYDSQDDYTPG